MTWTAEALCPTCGKGPFKAALGWNAHQRSKGHPDYGPSVRAVRPAVDPEAIEDEPLVPVITTGAFTPGAVRFGDPEGIRNWGVKGIRSLKMAYARHDDCQRADNGPGWWYRCEAKGHQPFFTPDHYGERIVEDLGPPDANGDRVVLATKTVKVKIAGTPNTIQIPYTGRHNGNDNDAIRFQRGMGRRLLEEVGLSPRCQFWECWVKLDATVTDLSAPGALGFCCEDHRKAAGADRGGVLIEAVNEKKKERQWATL